MPRTPRIGRDQIIDAAILVADRDGLAGLTMKRLGQELGVEAMSLYRYFPTKDAVLVTLAETLIARIAIPVDARTGDWETVMRAALASVRDLARRHPNLFVLMLDRAPHSLTEARLIEGFIGMMRSVGLDGPTALSVFRVLSDYSIGFALAELRGFALEPDRSSIDLDDLPQHEFPEIARLRPTLARIDHDAEFAFGLDLLFVGVRALIAISDGPSTDDLSR